MTPKKIVRRKNHQTEIKNRLKSGKSYASTVPPRTTWRNDRHAHGRPQWMRRRSDATSRRATAIALLGDLRFEHDVERCFGDAVQRREAGARDDVPESRLTRLRAECGADVLRQGARRAQQGREPVVGRADRIQIVG